jgi:hypothetical protein
LPYSQALLWSVGTSASRRQAIRNVLATTSPAASAPTRRVANRTRPPLVRREQLLEAGDLVGLHTREMSKRPARVTPWTIDN